MTLTFIFKVKFGVICQNFGFFFIFFIIICFMSEDVGEKVGGWGRVRRTNGAPEALLAIQDFLVIFMNTDREQDL